MYHPNTPFQRFNHGGARNLATSLLFHCEQSDHLLRMKQKVVISVQMEDAKKRCKALKVAVGLPGVLSAAIEGVDKNKIVVIGDGVDSITLVTLLRKRMGSAELISLTAVEEMEESTPAAVWSSRGGGYPAQYYNVNEAPMNHCQDPSCCIM